MTGVLCALLLVAMSTVLSAALLARLPPALLRPLVALSGGGSLRMLALPVPRALAARAEFSPPLLGLPAPRLLAGPGSVGLPAPTGQLVVLPVRLASAMTLLVLLLPAVLRPALPERLRGSTAPVAPVVGLDLLPVRVEPVLVLHRMMLAAVAALVLVRRPGVLVARTLAHPVWPLVVAAAGVLARVRFLVFPLVTEVMSVHGVSWVVESSASRSLPVRYQALEPEGPVAGIRKVPESR